MVPGFEDLRISESSTNQWSPQISSLRLPSPWHSTRKWTNLLSSFLQYPHLPFVLLFIYFFMVVNKKSCFILWRKSALIQFLALFPVGFCPALLLLLEYSLSLCLKPAVIIGFKQGIPKNQVIILNRRSLTCNLPNFKEDVTKNWQGDW